MIPVFERAKIFHVLDRAAAEIGMQTTHFMYYITESVPETGIEPYVATLGDKSSILRFW
jgi:hypothetical protein